MPRRSDRPQRADDIPKAPDPRRLSAATPEQVRSAYQDLHHAIRTLAQQEQLPEPELQNLNVKLHTYLKLLRHRGSISWDDVEYHEIIHLRHPAKDGQAVKIRALLERMTETLLVPTPDGGDLHGTLIFRELDGPDRIESIATVNTALISHLNELKRYHHVFDVLATVVLMPIPLRKEQRFHLVVHDIRPSNTPLQIVRATKAELAEAQQLLTELDMRQESVFDYIYATLVRGLDIQGLERAPELRDSLKAVILQAFSDGWINHTSAKLHSLVIGAPAVGKKLLVSAAGILNPISQEAHPSKITTAGVCSTATLENTTWRSRPGYLPLAHGGVFAIQDFHLVRDTQRQQLLGIFNMAMEDGKVIDSTAAKQEHPALTSIHIDTNRKTDLFPGSQLRGETIVAKRLDDVRIPMTALSRFDFIIDIPRDTTRQLDIALAMYQRLGDTIGPSGVESESPGWARQLQVLVAFLRTEHLHITFPEKIKRYMQAKHQALSSVHEELIAQRPWLSDFQTRLTNSVHKFAAAYARMNNRAIPVREDIDGTFQLIQRKFDFIIALAEHLQVATTWSVPTAQNLDAWLRSRFAAQEVKTGEILTAYKEEFNVPLGRRNLDRHLPHVARQIKKGRWTFPS